MRISHVITPGAPANSRVMTLSLAVLGAFLLLLALPSVSRADTAVATTAATTAATPVTSGPSVDTVTVLGTPRTSTTPVTGPQVESPGWRASDPGIPEADSSTYSAASTATTPSPTQPGIARPVSGNGGRAEGGGIPWWVLLLVAGGIAVAAN